MLRLLSVSRRSIARARDPAEPLAHGARQVAAGAFGPAAADRPHSQEPVARRPYASWRSAPSVAIDSGARSWPQGQLTVQTIDPLRRGVRLASRDERTAPDAGSRSRGSGLRRNR